MSARRAIAACIAALLPTPALASEPEDEVVVEVRGALLPRGDDATTASTVLRGDELDRPGASTAEIVSASPGAQIARTGGPAELATVTLRGATSAQTPVFLGPIPLNDELTGTADLSAVPTFFLRRIVLHRGHGPLSLPLGGLSGAVELEPLVPSGARALASWSAGSFGTASAAAFASYGNDRGAAATSLRLERTAGTFDYNDDRGTSFDPTDDRVSTRQNADAAAVDLWTTGRARLGQGGTLDGLVRVFARDQGVPGLGVLPARRARARARQALAVARGEVTCDTAGVSVCDVETIAWARASSYSLDDPGGELLFVRGRQETRATSLGSRVRLRLAPLEGLLLDASSSLALSRVAVDARGAGESSAARTTFRGAAGLTAAPLSWLDLVLEGSVQSESLAAPGERAASVLPQARLGAALRPTSFVEVFTSLGRYARVPTLGEQFGVTASVLGNPRLGPETGLSADLGARAIYAPAAGFGLEAELVLYGRHASDLIVYQKSSFGALTPYNVGEARFLGLEATVVTRLLGFVRASTALTLSDPRDITEGRAVEADLLPFQAQVALAPSLGVDFPNLFPRLGWDAARAALRFQYRSARAGDPAGLVRLPSQALLELEASVRIFGALELTGRLANLTNDRTTDLIGYPLPGRSGFVELTGGLF